MLNVCTVDDLLPGDVLRVEPLGSAPIAIFNVEGELHAVDDTCSHQEASLSEGWVEDGAVECPLHGVCFDLRTGAHSGLPARRGLRTYAVLVADGAVWLDAGAAADVAADAA